MSTEAYSGPVREIDDEGDDTAGEILSSDDIGTALTSVDRAAIDSQIATAKKYPRSITKSLREATTLATLDEATAASMIYSVKRAGKVLSGPSARMAEVMAYSWGNLRIDADVAGTDAKDVTARGTCFDLEKNVAIRVSVKRRITDKHGKRYNDDMIVTTGNAAISIALRNSVFKVIPRALVSQVYEAARKASLGKGGTMTQKRQAAIDWWGKLGVSPEEIFTLLEVKGIEDVGEDELITLRGLANAVKDGEQSVEDLFRPSNKSEGTQTLNAAINDKKAAKPVSATTTSQPSASKKEEPTTGTQQPATDGRTCASCGGRDGVHKPDCPFYAD